MNYLEKVRSVVQKMRLPITPDGHFESLDSLTVVNLVSTLETETGVVIPPHALVPETFESIATIAGMLKDVAG